jgi:transcriptional regulator with XRE-family HTH domain
MHRTSLEVPTVSADTTTSPRAAQRWEQIRRLLADARQAYELSQDDVALTAGLSSRTTVGRIERGEAIPGADTLIAHAAALGHEVVLIPPHLAQFLALSTADISAIVRAASLAIDHRYVLTTEMRLHVADALIRLQQARSS